MKSNLLSIDLTKLPQDYTLKRLSEKHIVLTKSFSSLRDISYCAFFSYGDLGETKEYAEQGKEVFYSLFLKQLSEKQFIVTQGIISYNDNDTPINFATLNASNQDFLKSITSFQMQMDHDFNGTSFAGEHFDPIARFEEVYNFTFEEEIYGYKKEIDIQNLQNYLEMANVTPDSNFNGIVLVCYIKKGEEYWIEIQKDGLFHLRNHSEVFPTVESAYDGLKRFLAKKRMKDLFNMD